VISICNVSRFTIFSAKRSRQQGSGGKSSASAASKRAFHFRFPISDFQLGWGIGLLEPREKSELT
jgi:hypothetical protein